MVTRSYSLSDAFDAVCADPYANARAAAKAGRKVAGFMCSYSPQELFHAAGYVPVRILGRQGGVHRADELLQAYACSFARSTLDSALCGELDFLDLVVFSHTCDTMQNLAELWKRNVAASPVLIVSVPTLTVGGPATAYFRAELARIRAALEERCGKISDEALSESIRMHQTHRQLMQRVYALRRAHPDLLTGGQVMSIVLSSLLMPKEEHTALLRELIEEIESGGNIPPAPFKGGERTSPALEDSGTPFKGGPRVLVAGSVCQNIDFITTIEAAGCTIVDDDLCMGSRQYCLPECAHSDPMDALVEMYLTRTPCPAFHTPGFDPGKHILDKAQYAGADGVVFLQTKFCDPWAFDYPHIQTTLEREDLPILLLEVEQHLPPSEQFRTRVHAFTEMLHARTEQ